MRYFVAGKTELRIVDYKNLIKILNCSFKTIFWCRYLISLSRRIKVFDEILGTGDSTFAFQSLLNFLILQAKVIRIDIYTVKTLMKLQRS